MQRRFKWEERMIRLNESDYIISLFPPSYSVSGRCEGSKDKNPPPEEDTKTLDHKKAVNIHDTRFKC